MSEVPDFIRAYCERLRERSERQRQRRMRRQLALRDNPLGNAELAAAEAEADAFFSAVDEHDQALAELDRLAVEQEHGEDDDG